MSWRRSVVSATAAVTIHGWASPSMWAMGRRSVHHGVYPRVDRVSWAGTVSCDHAFHDLLFVVKVSPMVGRVVIGRAI